MTGGSHTEQCSFTISNLTVVAAVNETRALAGLFMTVYSLTYINNTHSLKKRKKKQSFYKDLYSVLGISLILDSQ